MGHEILDFFSPLLNLPLSLGIKVKLIRIRLLFKGEIFWQV